MFSGRIAFLLLLLQTDPVFAKDYALVLGGTSSRVGSTHDFGPQVALAALGLKEKGYETKVLFGEGAEKTYNPEVDKKWFKVDGTLLTVRGERGGGITYCPEHLYHSADYRFLNSKKLIDGASSDKNIDDYFNALIKNAKPGDRVEIYIAAHGSNGGGHNLRIRNGDRLDRGLYSTKKILEYVKALDAKGIFTNLNLESCYSGDISSQLRELHLQNACVFMSSGTNGISTFCDEDDADDSNNLPGVGDVMTLQYYAGIIGKLEKEPYFKNSRCFQRLKNYYNTHKNELTFKNVQDTYWVARKYDPNLEEPALSSMLDSPYFQRSHFGQELPKPNEATCRENLINADELIKDVDVFLNNSTEKIIGPLKQKLADTVAQYNASVRKQNEIFYGDKAELAAEQKRTKTLAADVILQERVLMDKVHDLTPTLSSTNNPCGRSR